MKVRIGVSNRHCHLTREVLDILFGEGYELTMRNRIRQVGQYACNETVSIRTEKNTIEKVRILGPLRPYTQVEVSKTDSYFLGINPPIRDSGDLENSETVTIIGPKGEYNAVNSTIIANRHIHLDPDTAFILDLKNGDKVCVKVDSIKGGIMKDVYIKVDSKFFYEMHLDTDDSNAFMLKTGDVVEIEKY